MGYITDVLINILLELLSILLNWRHLLILLFIVALGFCIYKFLVPLFG